DSGIPRHLVVRETPLSGIPPEMPIQEVYKVMVQDEARNRLIVEDVSAAVHEGRKCLVLSQRKVHCKLLADRLTQQAHEPYLLSGAVGKKARTAILGEIKE